MIGEGLWAPRPAERLLTVSGPFLDFHLKEYEILQSSACYLTIILLCQECFVEKYVPSCSGEKLACAKSREESAHHSPVPFDKIGDMTIPPELKCLGTCNVQDYPYTTSQV